MTNRLTRRGMMAGSAALVPTLASPLPALAQGKAQLGTPRSVISEPPREFGPRAQPSISPDPDVLRIDPGFTNFLIGQVGWRGAYVCLAALTFVIAFPAVALWIREPRPGEGEHRAAVHATELRGLTTREAARQNRFWILAVAFFLVAVAINGTVSHVVPLLTDRGLSAAAAGILRRAAPRAAGGPAGPAAGGAAHVRRSALQAVLARPAAAAPLA